MLAGANGEVGVLVICSALKRGRGFVQRKTLRSAQAQTTTEFKYRERNVQMMNATVSREKNWMNRLTDTLNNYLADKLLYIMLLFPC